MWAFVLWTFVLWAFVRVGFSPTFLGVTPFEFLDEFFIPKTRVRLGLSVGEDFVILACVVFTQCHRVTDGQTDGHSDRS